MIFTSSLKGLLLTHKGGEGEEDEDEEEDEEYSFADRTPEISTSLPPNKNEKAAHTRTTAKEKYAKEEKADCSIEEQFDNKSIEEKGARKGKVGRRGREEDDEEDEMQSVTSLIDFSSNPSTSTSPTPSTSALPRHPSALKNILQADKVDRNYSLGRPALSEEEVEEENDVEVEEDDDAYLDSFVIDDDEEDEGEEEDIEVEEGVEVTMTKVLQSKTRKTEVENVVEAEDEVDDDFNVNFSGSFSHLNSYRERNQNFNSDSGVSGAKESRNLDFGSGNAPRNKGDESKKRNDEAGLGEIGLEGEKEDEKEDSYSGDFDVSR